MKLYHNGQTSPLVIASRREYQGVVELDCEADIYVCHIDGMTSLIIASTHSHLDVVEALLEPGADIDERNSGASAGLLSASGNRSQKVVGLLAM